MSRTKSVTRAGIVAARQGADDDGGGGILIVLQAVGDEIGEQLRDADRIAAHVGERAVRQDARLFALDEIDEILPHGGDDLDQVERPSAAAVIRPAWLRFSNSSISEPSRRLARTR